ncbi:MAG: DUF547 domain-containing protein [Cyanobacteria bacterium SZAS LIN-3]|nr:DUF547 domain-containing protein [Cyanobacteria bacterium SZAS LIN-3]
MLMGSRLVIGVRLLPLLLVLFSVGFACCSCAPAQAFDTKYKLYGRQLKKYVVAESGFVHYKRWQKDRSGLDSFVKSLALLDKETYEKFDEKERLAFWLNAYNALAIKSVLDHYPVKATVDYFPPNSIRQFNDGWERLKFEVMGQTVTLYDIEHERLRRGFRDPRMHFAVASASVDSAKLSPEPYVGAGLDQRLDGAARRFLAQDNALVLDPVAKTVRVSKLFSWFTLDFASRAGFGKALFPPPADEEVILSYIELYVPEDKRRILKQGGLKFDYLVYDWSLNDADAVADEGSPKL